MRLSILSFRFKLIIVICLLSALLARAAPSPSLQISGIQEPDTSTPFTNNATNISKRAGFTKVTIANGWHVQYRVFDLITPAIPAILQLRQFYYQILKEVDHRASIGELAGAVLEMSIGDFTLSFIAEAGYSNAVHWDIIIAFVEKMLENRVPTTFMCHLAPPGSAAGIKIKLWVKMWTPLLT
ncbi:MAG: hypothetical protein Q9225_001694 [Loekoesia sp. 1 TL-2023]